MLSDSQGCVAYQLLALSPMLTSAADNPKQRLNGALSSLI